MLVILRWLAVRWRWWFGGLLALPVIWVGTWALMLYQAEHSIKRPAYVSAPQGLEVALDRGVVKLGWNAGSSRAKAFTVWRNHRYLAYTTEPYYTDSALAPSTTYGYTVVAIDASHQTSVPSNRVEITTPAQLQTGQASPDVAAETAAQQAAESAAASAAAAKKAASAAGGTAAALAQSNSFVTKSGTHLLISGQNFRFTGLNIYDANSRSNCGASLGTGSGLDQALTNQGPGKEVFRAWFFQTLATSGGGRDWAAFDHTVAVAKAHGYRIIATLGNQWGDCEDGVYKTANWYAGGYKSNANGGISDYRDWVAEVVTRYKNDPTIITWQLMNEAETKDVQGGSCTSGGAGILRSFADDMGGVVRAHDPNHLVSLGTMGGGQCGTQGGEYQTVHASPNIDLCEYHDYNDTAPMPGNQYNGMSVRINQCNALGKPLFVGETGYIPNQVGGTLQARADLYAQKFAAQFGAGVVGELVWSWSNEGSTLDNYKVGVGDPTLGVLAQY
jgi:mannan endo-1,4-beta-mannosidase